MKEKLLKYKVELLVVAVLLVFGLVILLLLNTKKSVPIATEIDPKPSISKTPASQQLIPSYINPRTEELKVVSVSPDPEKDGPFYNDQVFTVTFNDAVKPTKLFYGERKKFPFGATQGENFDQIKLTPQDGRWNVNQDYAITIYPQSESESGKIMKKPYEFIFRIVAPANIDGI